MQHSPRFPHLCALFILCAGAARIAGAQNLAFTRADLQLGVDVHSDTYGPAWGDFDSDGFDDVFVDNHFSAGNLFHNYGGLVFIDEILDSGIPTAGDQHGVAWGDMDNDGLRDLYIVLGDPGTTGSAPNQLMWNLEGGQFVDISSAAGTTDSTGRGRFVHWFDVNNDGWLDLLVTNTETPNRLFLNRGNHTFASVPDAGGLSANSLRLAAITELNNDGYLDVLLTDCDAGYLQLFRNMHDGTFQDITAGSGLPAWPLCVWSTCWFDYNNDGAQDLYLCRGYWPCHRDAYTLDPTSFRFQTFMSPVFPEDGLDGFDIVATSPALDFRIRIDGAFGPNARIYLGQSGVHPTGNHFVADDGQYLGQPYFTPGASFGCYIWQDAAGGPWHLRTSTDFGATHRFWAEVTDASGGLEGIAAFQLETDLPSAGNLPDRLYRNNGNGTFTDVSEQAGIGDAQSGKNCVAADFDNDGWMDIYVVNDREISGLLALHAPNLLYRNNGNGTFTECAAAAGVDCRVTGTGSAAAWSDYDHDGFADLFVTNGCLNWPFNNGPHVVFHNEGNGNHWIKIRLVGTTCNRDAIGARVKLLAGYRAQYRVVTGGVIDAGQSSADLLFGLGSATSADAITVWWPDGEMEICGGLPADRTYVLRESYFSDVAVEPAAAVPVRLAPPRPNPARGTTTLSYWLPGAMDTELAIYDVSGRQVCLLARGAQGPGDQTVTWNGRDAFGARMAPGVYFSRLKAGSVVRSQRLLMVE
jgi:hypothetical protein